MRRLANLFCSIVLFLTGIVDRSKSAQFNLYEIYPHQHCLYYYVLNDIVDYDVLFLPTHQIISYCLQIPEDDRQDTFLSEEVTNYDSLFTFAELKRNGISAEHLIGWSAPIDVAELYQIFLDDPNELSFLLEFYNCTNGWFGPRCEYTLYENDLTFAELVRSVFSGKLHDYERNNLTAGPCYIHLQCDRGPSTLCLDWREICDGKRVCDDGADESQQCLEREANECSNGYYRCHNGQCIPEEFYDDDDTLNPDCSDWTDIKIYLHDRLCVSDPAFRCEEHICFDENDFTYSDGRCILLFNALSDNSKYHRFNLEHRNLLANNRNPHLSDKCVFAMTCFTKSYDLIADDKKCVDICRNTTMCITLLQTANCPSFPFVFPRDSVAFGHVHLIYSINETLFMSRNRLLLPFLICYDEQLCGLILQPSVYYSGYTCRYPSEVSSDLPDRLKSLSWMSLVNMIHSIFRQCAATISFNCTALFQCPQSSKCISKHRLLDGRKDCLDNGDEEVNNTCSLKDPYRFQCSSNPNLCISPLLVRNVQSDCPDGEDEKQFAQTIGYKSLPPFAMLCDSRIDMDPIIVDDRKQTDETDCGSHFPCDNQYTHCDGFWHCINGIDEADCPLSLCKPFHHPCVSLVNMSIQCLPLEFVDDGILHCRGGSDERHFCRNMFPEEHGRRYRCYNQTLRCINLETLCDRNAVDDLDDGDLCDGEEERICPEVYYQDLKFRGICWHTWDSKRSASEKIICDLDETNHLENYNYSDSRLYLRLTGAGNFPSSTQDASQQNKTISHEEHVFLPLNTLLHYTHRAWFCNRGMVIFIGGLEQRRCLCPPTYYGDRCQFQNQRVSLILRFNTQTTSNWRTVLYLIIMLIDNDYVIQSYDYNIYVPVRDCELKFHLYLTYASRPKNSTKNYSVVIHAFNKQDLTYYTSWYLSIPFQFLPVNHLVNRLIIREQRTKNPDDCRLKCGRYGQCMKYENTNEEFCRCVEGWWGNLCERNYHCDCSQDSKCVGTISNRSICLCPLGKFGLRCYLTSSSCQLDTCQHGGTCIPVDERMSKENFTCLCIDGYSGKRCEISSTQIDISFDDVTIPQSFFGHFITARDDDFHIRTTIFRKILYEGNTVTLYRSLSFHILFIEFFKDYYLAVLQEKYTPSKIISTKVHPSHRCPSIDTLFNETILNYHRLQRIKYYHLPCQMKKELKCFYDEEYMCLCNLDHHANCFDFDHDMTYNCQGVNYCENNGKCFQDHPSCPTATICVCDECFYGTHCQLSTKGFDLSLDAILSYQIYSHLSFSRQPWPLKISLIITILMFVVGIINASLSIIIFQPKNFQIGCDVYLFVASITSLLTTIVFIFKFSLLILSQMNLITNHSVLLINCISVNFALKFLPNIGDWLYVCVALERMIICWKGATFDKLKSINTAKRIVFLVYIVVIGTGIHDPIHRQLIKDTEEQRTWCIVEYSSTLKIFNLITNIGHLVIPFIANFMSALLTIITIARQRSTVRKNQTYQQHLYLEFYKQKHLIISSCVLVVFALPRLVMSFTFRCMKSARDPWLFLVGYFLPFIPSISIFVIFVLPSETYTKLFKKLLQRPRRFL